MRPLVSMPSIRGGVASEGINHLNTMIKYYGITMSFEEASYLAEHKKHRDYRRVGVSTLAFVVFVVVCLILDNQGAHTHFLLWLSFKDGCLSIYWPSSTSAALLGGRLPLNLPLDTMIPLIPLGVVIAYVNKLGQYLNMNPFYFRRRRIHHYHVGIAMSVVGVVLASVRAGVEALFLNGKETSLLEVSQGLGLCVLIGGIAFIILDSEDFRNRNSSHA
jgi:hypothetical protein